MLAEDRWIEVRQIGENGTVNAYIVNDRVAWFGPRDGIRYSLFRPFRQIGAESDAKEL